MPPETPSLSLEFTHQRTLGQQRTHSEVIVLAAVFLLVFSYFRHGLSIARLFAPELAITVCVLSALFYGVGLIAIIIVGVLALLRVSWLARILAKRFTAVPAAAVAGKQPSTLTAPPAPPPA